MHFNHPPWLGVRRSHVIAFSDWMTLFEASLCETFYSLEEYPGRGPGSGPRPGRGGWRRRCGWNPPSPAWRRTAWSGQSAGAGRADWAPPAATTSATSARQEQNNDNNLSQIITFSVSVPLNKCLLTSPLICLTFLQSSPGSVLSNPNVFTRLQTLRVISGWICKTVSELVLWSQTCL